tara:strand:- start:102 stop:209 length:108 start_codon:yes stop_codon:yes gene_type:complete
MASVKESIISSLPDKSFANLELMEKGYRIQIVLDI